MNQAANDDVVAHQYQQWMYPEPIEDLSIWLENQWQLFDPSHAHRTLWPERDYLPNMRILVAGCGANQAAVFAYNNPSATVVAIDVSQRHLAHHELLKQRHELHNLEMHLLPIEQAHELSGTFDLIISTGVLHHLVDPLVGMRALANCLRPDGVAAFMLYARYGRIGVEMLESVFQDLGLGQDYESVAIVQDALAIVPSDHPVRSYQAIAPDLGFDGGIVDTFLHARARSFTVDECLTLTQSAGLHFQDWLFHSPYEPDRQSSSTFLNAVAELPDAQRWSVMERVNAQNACHLFMARRDDSFAGQARIDLSSQQALDYVPDFRHRAGLDGTEVVRPGLRIALSPVECAMVERIDGHSTMRDIAHQVLVATSFAGEAGELDETVAHELLRLLWERDFISLSRWGA